MPATRSSRAPAKLSGRRGSEPAKARRGARQQGGTAAQPVNSLLARARRSAYAALHDERVERDGVTPRDRIYCPPAGTAAAPQHHLRARGRVTASTPAFVARGRPRGRDASAPSDNQQMWRFHCRRLRSRILIGWRGPGVRRVRRALPQSPPPRCQDTTATKAS